jgi:hypothetical protein
MELDPNSSSSEDISLASAPRTPSPSPPRRRYNRKSRSRSRSRSRSPPSRSFESECEMCFERKFSINDNKEKVEVPVEQTPCCHKMIHRMCFARARGNRDLCPYCRRRPPSDTVPVVCAGCSARFGPGGTSYSSTHCEHRFHEHCFQKYVVNLKKARKAIHLYCPVVTCEMPYTGNRHE